MDLTFSGTENPKITFDPNGYTCKEVFKRFENGEYKNKEIITRHPNIVFSVIKGKKSWGLHIKMWSEGICDCDFRLSEIINDFNIKNIEIPKSFMMEFQNLIIKGTFKKLKNPHFNINI